MKTTRIVAALCILSLAPMLAADEPAKTESKLHSVKTGQIKVEVQLDALVEAAQMWPVRVELKATQGSALKVLEAVEHGSSVTQGQVLVRFNTEDLDRTIRDAELAAAVARVALDREENEFATTARSVALETESLERARARKLADYKHYNEVTLPRLIVSAQRRLKQSEFGLEYAREELRQLQKMYTEDNITEETEEIVLKRTQRDVEATAEFFEAAQESHHEMVDIAIPRRTQDEEAGLKVNQVETDKKGVELPLRLKAAQQALEKARNALTDAEKKLTELRADRDLLMVKAPADGVLWYGRCVKGKWSDGEKTADAVELNGPLNVAVPFMTVVQGGEVHALATVAEAQMRDVSDGMTGWFIPTATPDAPLDAKITSLLIEPGTPHLSQLTASLTADAAASLRLGQTGKLLFVAYEKSDAIKVPLAAVKSDVPGVHYVFAKSPDGTLQKRDIKLGRKVGTDAEVLDGLMVGDEIQPKGEPTE